MSRDAAFFLMVDAPLTLRRGRGSWREGELKLNVGECECTKLLKTPVREGSWGEKMTLA